MVTPVRPRARHVVSAAIVTSLLAMPGVVGAQTGPSGRCSASSLEPVAFPSAGFDAGYAATIVSGNSYYRRSITVDAAVPAGSYLIDTVAYDGYTGRTKTVPQPVEQYVLEFLSAGGAVLARTAATPDLPDSVEEATWSGSVGGVELAEPATQIRAIHRFADDAAVNAAGSANSVQPTCVGFVPVQPPTTTEQPPTTTEQPPTTTEQPPTTTEVPPTTTVIEPPSTTSSLPPTSVPPTTAPSTSAAPTSTTSVPTQVLPVAQENPAPTPVSADPQFTG